MSMHQMYTYQCTALRHDSCNLVIITLKKVLNLQDCGRHVFYLISARVSNAQIEEVLLHRTVLVLYAERNECIDLQLEIVLQPFGRWVDQSTN